MIKANELRIGNWVNTEHGLGKVCSLYANKKNEFAIGVVVKPMIRYEYLNPTITPIPVTPEMIESSGFRRDDGLVWNKKYSNGYTFSLYCSDTEIVQALKEYTVAAVQEIDFNSYSYVGQPIKYLHQLQNRYYSITGEEIEINIEELLTSHP